MYTFMISRRRVYLFVLAVFFLFTHFGCGSKNKEEELATNIPGMRTYVSRILISPLAFDGAVVAVKGIAHDVQEISEGGQRTITTFRLFDLKGNFLNVSIQGKQDIIENDLLIVGGIYRRVKNEIEAVQLEKIELEE